MGILEDNITQRFLGNPALKRIGSLILQLIA